MSRGEDEQVVSLKHHMKAKPLFVVPVFSLKSPIRKDRCMSNPAPLISMLAFALDACVIKCIYGTFLRKSFHSHITPQSNIDIRGAGVLLIAFNTHGTFL